MLKTLSETQVKQFMELGWIKIEAAYSRKQALAAAEILWEKLEEGGVLKNEPSTWTQPLIRLNEVYDAIEFQDCNTERLWSAIEDIVGTGRLEHRGNKGWGWWVMNFSVGSDEPWTVPAAGWHHDGQFRHYINSGDQGLLQLCFFSEVKSHGGAPLIIEGSHNIVARVLKQHQEGLEFKEANELEVKHPWYEKLVHSVKDDSLNNKAIASERISQFMDTVYHDPETYSLRVVEATGSPGDVILGHPFLIHNSSQNHMGIPRFLCTTRVSLKEPMNLQRSRPEDYSILELSTIKAMG